MRLKQRPEYSEKYPAIDGIAKEERPSKGERDVMIAENPLEEVYYHPSEKAIRPDIENILGLDDAGFDEWYKTRKSVAERLLKDYEVVGTIPHLQFGSRQNNLTCISHLSGVIESLEEGLEYLEIIKKVRTEQKD